LAQLFEEVDRNLPDLSLFHFYIYLQSRLFLKQILEEIIFQLLEQRTC